MAVSSEGNTVSLWDACLHTAQLKRAENCAEEAVSVAQTITGKYVDEMNELGISIVIHLFPLRLPPPSAGRVRAAVVASLNPEPDPYNPGRSWTRRIR